MLNKLIDPQTIICRKLLNIVVSSSINIVGRILILCSFVQLLSMIKGYNFITFSMNHKDWALDVGHSVDIREVVKWESPSQIEHDSESRH